MSLPDSDNAVANGYEGRNDRATCICGALRADIANRIWWVCDFQDKITPHYFYRCPNCLSYSAVNLRFEPSSYSNAHIDEYHQTEEKRELNRARIRWIVDSFHGHVPQRPVIFDLGSGEGQFTECAKAIDDAEITAVEADGRMFDRFAGTYEGVTLSTEYIEDFLAKTPRETADIVNLTDVLEHVLDPSSLLREIIRILRPGGIAYLTLPDARSYPHPRPVPAGEVDWSLANQTRQHLWMMDPRMLFRLVFEEADVIEYSRSFEEKIRRDSHYSTFIVRKRMEFYPVAGDAGLPAPIRVTPRNSLLGRLAHFLSGNPD
jgi:2-polyprenyl-3-methyl-5-hydroxy-6-metoxy-1,4-benzoquinol methylase